MTLCIYHVSKIQVNIIKKLKQFSREEVRVKQGGKRKNNGGKFQKDEYLYRSLSYICICGLPVVAWEKGAGKFPGHLCLFPNFGLCSVSLQVSHMDSQVLMLSWLPFFICTHCLTTSYCSMEIVKRRRRRKDRSLNHFYSIVRINVSATRTAYQEQHFEFTVLGFGWAEKAFLSLGLQIVQHSHFIS